MLDQPTPPPPPGPASPASDSSEQPMDPARAEALRSQLRGIALTFLEAMARPDPAEAARSTASERMMARVLRSQIPRLRDVLLSRLSATDPRGIERIIGATATALESILFYAPGVPEPRFRFEWEPNTDGTTGAHLELRPDVRAATVDPILEAVLVERVDG